MILHAKPIAYGFGDRCYSDWRFRNAGSKKGVDVPTEEPKEEFIKEEEFKV